MTAKTNTTNTAPVYTYTATGTGGYWVLVGDTTVGAVWGAKGAWRAHIHHTDTYGTGKSRSAALSNAMAPNASRVPVQLPPPVAMQEQMSVASPVTTPQTPTAPQAPTTPAPAPQGRSKARTALLALLWMLVGVCTLVAIGGRAYARLPLMLAHGATRASVALKVYARTL
jgi:hypothetical protein